MKVRARNGVVVTLGMLVGCLSGPPRAAADATRSPWSAQPLEGMERLYPEIEALYINLHQNPELSGKERQTAATFAQRLQALGYDVTAGVGGTGVVAILRNGGGPTVMLRTELDALPVEENTGLPYASKVTTVDDGKTVHVMHACGHDIHISGLVGAATLLAHAKDRWRGTLLIVGQPAEETLAGARAMLADGLFTRFPKPDFAFAIHTTNTLPAGTAGWRSGVLMASADSVNVTIYGKGGHGSAPQSTIDPIVIASRTVLALQTLVSRENNPLDAAVVTVGSIHAGNRPNVIPDEAKLEITVRALDTKVRTKLLLGIERIVRAEAAAAGAPREPTVTIVSSTDMVVNDPAMAKRLVPAIGRALSSAKVEEIRPFLAAEDFSQYGKAGAPTFRFYIGAAEPGAFAAAKANDTELPSNHSSKYAPDLTPTLKTAILTLTSGALELLGRN